MNDRELIQKVRILKAMDLIDSYYELADMIGMTAKSFYNWLGGYYTLGDQKKRILKDIISDLSI